MFKEIKVSVIIPIYNVAKFIERCTESLMKQTLDEVEYIFVNDATPDNSMELLYGILQCYPLKASETTPSFKHTVSALLLLSVG